MEWPIIEAKSKLNEVLALAHSKGPQVITKRGLPDAVVISFEEYEKLKPSQSFKDLLLSIPEACSEETEDPFERRSGQERDLTL